LVNSRFLAHLMAFPLILARTSSYEPKKVGGIFTDVRHEDIIGRDADSEHRKLPLPVGASNMISDIAHAVYY